MGLQLPDSIPIERVSTLVQWIERAQSSPGSQPVDLWFRGHARQVEDIRPAFLRHHVEEVLTQETSWAQKEAEWGGTVGPGEVQFNLEFRRRASSFLPGSDDLVETYLLAQHYGFPTRLLDWTTNPLAALFFAVSSLPPQDGEIVVTVPRYEVDGRNQDLEAGEPDWSDFPKHHDLVQRAIASLYGEGHRPEGPDVVYILPDLTNPRISQQGSCFSLHLSNRDPASQLSILRLPVPASAKPALQQVLRTMGVSWGTLFPDLEHISREMAASWGFTLADELQVLHGSST